jgi:hypothetical protein
LPAARHRRKRKPPAGIATGDGEIAVGGKKSGLREAAREVQRREEGAAPRGVFIDRACAGSGDSTTLSRRRRGRAPRL